MKSQLAQLIADLNDPRIDLGDQEIFVLHGAAKLRKKIAELEK